MARPCSGGRPVATDFRSAPYFQLLDLPLVLLEKILILLPEKMRVRATCVCKATYALGTTSRVLWQRLNTKRHSRQQCLQLLRWLAASPRATRVLTIQLHCQGVVPERQLGMGLAAQAASLQSLRIMVRGAVVSISGSWLTQLVSLRYLDVDSTRSVELGAACSALTRLTSLTVAGSVLEDDGTLWQVDKDDPPPATIHASAIPAGLVSARFIDVALEALPPALCAAARSLKTLTLNGCRIVPREGQPESLNSDGGERMCALEQLASLTSANFRNMPLPGLPSQLTALRLLRELDLPRCECSKHRQASMDTLCQLSMLTMLRLSGSSWWAGLHGGQLGALPRLRKLTLWLPHEVADQRLPLLDAAPHARTLSTNAPALLCKSNLEGLGCIENLSVSFYDDVPGRTTPAGLLHQAAQVVQAAAQLPSLRYLALQVYPDLIEGFPSFVVEQLLELQVPAGGGEGPGVRTVMFFSEADHAAVGKLWPPSPATRSALDFVASMPASSWIRLLGASEDLAGVPDADVLEAYC